MAATYGSYLSISVTCAGQTVVSSTLYSSDTYSSYTTTSLDSYYYSACAARLSNDVDEVMPLILLIIYHSNPNLLAFRSFDLRLYFLTAKCYYSRVILPNTSRWLLRKRFLS